MHLLCHNIKYLRRYTEYYPEGIGLYGEYVDWVGLDFYEKDWDEDNLIPQDMFIANIKNGQDGVDFYEKFSVGKDKPMLIAETGAFDSNEDLTAAGERNPLSDAEQTNFRNEWIKQVYDVSTLKDELPRLNAICYFHHCSHCTTAGTSPGKLLPQSIAQVTHLPFYARFHLIFMP